MGERRLLVCVFWCCPAYDRGILDGLFSGTLPRRWHRSCSPSSSAVHPSHLARPNVVRQAVLPPLPVILQEQILLFIFIALSSHFCMQVESTSQKARQGTSYIVTRVLKCCIYTEYSNRETNRTCNGMNSRDPIYVEPSPPSQSRQG